MNTKDVRSKGGRLRKKRPSLFFFAFSAHSRNRRKYYTYAARGFVAKQAWRFLCIPQRKPAFRKASCESARKTRVPCRASFLNTIKYTRWFTLSSFLPRRSSSSVFLTSHVEKSYISRMSYSSFWQCDTLFKPYIYASHEIVIDVNVICIKLNFRSYMCYYVIAIYNSKKNICATKSFSRSCSTASSIILLLNWENMNICKTYQRKKINIKNINVKIFLVPN